MFWSEESISPTIRNECGHNPNTIATSVKIQSSYMHVEVIPIIKVLVDPVHYHCQK